MMYDVEGKWLYQTTRIYHTARVYRTTMVYHTPRFIDFKRGGLAA
jgi:hypothetical protein